ncbi:uncharacterized protein LOC129913187 isoform X3 [Episyrphus balteatus]|uniref:uncharacterized protein LOC129913187 isoform X3 n=1 Tax=Episyrphus balteatus TaxID=286459 RepID=UPI00248605F2|nr:uncharacterized protein LOC129913187 isoform X3 [Episyrphus balteatus]
MTRFKIKNQKILTCCLIWVALFGAHLIRCSEFPERECCDLTTTSTVGPLPLPPAMPTEKSVATSSVQTISVGRSGSNIKAAIAILNCILARQLCFEDPSCSAILEIIPRVCGPIPVSCSTVTVTKCQAALRTLQAFQFFRPTCLCKEPGVDPDCNHFRDFLFDHPCGFVLKKEKDPYPIDALPTCNHALSVCQQERKCLKLFEDFKVHCKVRDNKCRMDDREACHDSWTNLRLSPMFGCICPNNHMKKRCDRIFNIVNHNPCVVRIMGMDESYHQRVFEDNMALIDTPLIAPINTHYSSQHHGVITYPFNVSDFQRSTLPTATGDGIVIDGNTNSYQSGQDVEADLSSEIIKQHFQSTCHTALDTCREDPSCSTSLQPMLMHCEMHRCNRNACMNSLQAFYKGPHEDLNLDIAFCLCKKTTNRHDMCMIAQEKLHPVCAQRPPDSINLQNSNGIFYHPPPACHVVADLCKEDRECRIKLEYYEQACAVDSVTKKCAGRPSGCRQAMLGILGTSLRTTCACQGTDSQYLYQCVGWRRLLWMNPCVVEAQKDFHMKRLAELGLLITTTTTTTTTTTLPPPTTTTTKQAPMVLKQPKNTQVEVFRQHPTKTKSEPTSVETNYIEQPDSIPETLLHSGNGENGNTGNDDYHGSSSSSSSGGSGSNGINGDSGISSASSSNGNGRSSAANGSKRKANGNGGGGSNGSNGHHRERTEPEEPTIVILPTTTTERVTTTEPTTTSTTTMMTTTTQAPRNCVAQRPHQSDQLIREGTSKRIYSLDDAECSELCTCGESLTLTCHALCVPFAPCRTALAFYSHASPAYQAFRGRCLCYSGRFICMKPPLGEYTLPGGVFLLLGYSSADEALLRPHTNLGVQDAVRALQQYVTTHIDNQTMCTLTLFNMTDENIIIAARLPHDAKLKAIDVLRKEKEECTNILKTISHHINTEHSELQSHRLLSIFKMSEVEVIWPESSSANSPTTILLGKCTLITSLMFSLLPFVSWTFLKIAQEET